MTAFGGANVAVYDANMATSPIPGLLSNAGIKAVRWSCNGGSSQQWSPS